jgi:hypothetical protein
MVSHSMLMAGVFAAATLYYVRDSGLLAGRPAADQRATKAHSAGPAVPPAELNVLELEDLSNLRVRFDYCTS